MSRIVRPPNPRGRPGGDRPVTQTVLETENMETRRPFRPILTGLLGLLFLLAAATAAAVPARAGQDAPPANAESCSACLRASDLEECHLVAVQLAQTGRLARAIAIESHIRERQPGNAEVAAALGRMYHMGKNPPRAIEAYHASLFATSGYPPALIGLGTIMEEQGETAIAARYFGRAVRENPEQPMFKVHLARVLVRDGRDQDARAIVEEIVRRWPGSQEAVSAEKLMSRTALARP